MSPAISFDLESPELSFTASGGALVSRTIHPSGLRILSESVPGALSTSIGFWVAVGSRDEESVAYGSTHFLEHLLFKGTPRRNALDIAIAFDQVGGEHNALTAKEHTCYYAKVQDHDLPMAIEVLADMVASSVLDPKEFEIERGVILEELAMADDDPSDVAHERLTEIVLRNHALGRPIGGNADTINASTRDSVMEHYRRYYHPHELVVTAAGAVEHGDLVEHVIRGLELAGWDLKNSRPPVPRRSQAPAVLDTSPQSLVVTRPLEQAVVALATHGLRATDERRPALSILSSVLGGGMSSRLFQEIRERRGLAYSVYSFASSYADAGMFGMAAGTSPSHASEVAKLMKAELEAIASEGITSDELERTKGNIAGASALALESSDARMMRLGRSEISTAEFVDRDEALARLSTVGLADIQSLASEFLSTPLSAVVVGAVKDGIVDDVVGGSVSVASPA